MTSVSSEDFVNIAWDSAGVTTDPVAVPLEHSNWVAGYLIAKLKLTTPGQGSLMVVPVISNLSDRAKEELALIPPGRF
jgi:hypothetical protein